MQLEKKNAVCNSYIRICINFHARKRRHPSNPRNDVTLDGLAKRNEENFFEIQRFRSFVRTVTHEMKPSLDQGSFRRVILWPIGNKKRYHIEEEKIAFEVHSLMNYDILALLQRN